LLIAWILECTDEGRYHFTDHALTKHPVAEGFTAGQAVDAMRRGSIIARRDDECRCIVAETAIGIKIDPAFIANSIHCVVKWDDVQRIVIITMYRPMSSEWTNQHTRRGT